MVEIFKVILQYCAIFVFIGLSIVGYIQRDWNLGLMLNLVLVVFYIFLYFQPIK